MSTTSSAGPGPAGSNRLIDSAFDVNGVPAIDRRIDALRERIRAAGPRMAQRVPHYWAEIDHLLDLRLWLTEQRA